MAKGRGAGLLERGLAGHSPLVAPSPSEIALCGRRFVADPTGALYWPEQSSLIVADLHLEKGSAAAERGRLVPPYDTRSTLELLAHAVVRHEPRRIIALGDSFHDTGAEARIDGRDREALRALQSGREWYWVTGNHDPELPSFVQGHVCPAVTLDAIKFRHEPVDGPASHEVAGHLHPAAKLARRGATVRRKCFVTDGTRLVLPAFGAYTGGLNVLDEVFAPLFPRQAFFVWMLSRDGVFPVSRRQLLGD